MRILFGNNFDMRRAFDSCRAGRFPSHHLYGVADLPPSVGVEILPFGESRLCEQLSRRSRWWLGDIEQEVASLRGHPGDDTVIYSAHFTTVRGLAMLPRSRRPPLVANVHGTMTGPPSLPERLATRLDGAIVYSTPARDWLASLGTPADRIHVVGWGPDTSFGLFTEIADQNRPAETGTPFVVSTGKASRDVTVLVRALAACGLPGRVLVSPAMRSELKASMAVPGNIELVDALPSNADALSFTYGHVEESLRMADIIAIPLEHQWAYGGMTELIDAMACAKPVVMTENPMNGVDVEAVGCGLSVGVGHFEGWVEALTTLAGRGPALAEMGRRGRDFCEHGFNQERFGKALLRICEGVLGGAG